MEQKKIRDESQFSSDIPLCVPEIRGNEWKYIKECLDTGWVSSVGAYVDRFEQAMSERVGCRFAVATTNGTAALHLALLVAGVQPGDEVITSTLTFISPVNAIVYCQAHPVLIDAEPRTWQLDPDLIEDFLKNHCVRQEDGSLINKHSGRRVRAILPVHILGLAAEMDAIMALAAAYNLPVIEDATEALGTLYKGRPAGSIGDIACFSYNGNKVITTGGGGMILTNNGGWAKRCKYLSTQAKDDPLEYIHHRIGYNYRLTNIQAAMGVAQLELLDEYITAKTTIAQHYESHLKDVPGITLMPASEHIFNTHWLYTVLIDQAEYGIDSRQLLRKLQEHNIQTRPLWQPMHISPVHQNSFHMGGAVSEQLNRDAISLPCSVGLSESDQMKVIAVIKDSYSS